MKEGSVATLQELKNYKDSDGNCYSLNDIEGYSVCGTSEPLKKGSVNSDDTKIIEIARVLAGLKLSNWKIIRETIDRLYNVKSAKLELDGFAELAEILRFNLK